MRLMYVLFWFRFLYWHIAVYCWPVALLRAMPLELFSQGMPASDAWCAAPALTTPLPLQRCCRSKPRAPGAPFKSHDTEFGVALELILLLFPVLAPTASKVSLAATPVDSFARLSALGQIVALVNSLRVYRPNEDVKPHPQLLSLDRVTGHLHKLLTVVEDNSAAAVDHNKAVLTAGVAAMTAAFDLSHAIAEPYLPAVFRVATKVASLARGTSGTATPPALLAPIVNMCVTWTETYNRLRRLPTLLRILGSTLSGVAVGIADEETDVGRQSEEKAAESSVSEQWTAAQMAVAASVLLDKRHIAAFEEVTWRLLPWCHGCFSVPIIAVSFLPLLPALPCSLS